MRLRILGVSEIYPHRGRPSAGSGVVGICRSVMSECDVTFLSPRFYSFLMPSDSWLSFYRGQSPFASVEGIPTHYALTPAWSSYFYIVCQTLMMRWALPWKAARLGTFDLVHAHGVIPAGDAGLRIARRLRLPLVVTAHGSDLNLYPRFPHLRKLVERVLHSADAVVTVSRALGGRARDLGRSRCIEWIPVGFDPGVFFPGAGREAVILYAGRLFEGKGLEELVDAFREVRRCRPAARLRVIGDGPLSVRLRERAGEGAEFVGAIPHAGVAEEMRRASVFCLPSHREGWPTSCVEALASGMRIVATGVGGLGELLLGAPGARIVPVGDPHALADALLDALNDPTPPAAIREHARPFEWAEIGKRYVNLYRSLRDAVPAV